MQTRRIHEYNLVIVLGLDPQDLVASGLWFAGGYADFLSENMVQECRFSNVGPPDNGDIAATPRPVSCHVWTIFPEPKLLRSARPCADWLRRLRLPDMVYSGDRPRETVARDHLPGH